MKNKKFLLTDTEVAWFIVNGYHIIEPDLPEGLNERIAGQLDELDFNPGNAITESIPELLEVLKHSAVDAGLVSLLGQNYELQSHRHWHCKLPGSDHMQWHQDSTNKRDAHINRFLGLYYPRNVTPEMGPTIIVPGTHFRNAPTDRMATYTNIRGQVPLVVRAGTFAFTHYDLWHGTAANLSGEKRHMIKFLFQRTQKNKGPTWNHDPEMLTKPRDWNGRKPEDVNNILAIGNPLGISQSDHYKERAIRVTCWKNLMGPNV